MLIRLMLMGKDSPVLQGSRFNSIQTSSKYSTVCSLPLEAINRQIGRNQFLEYSDVNWLNISKVAIRDVFNN